jgi:hypothetical protein
MNSPLNAYEIRQEARRERLERAAAKARAASEAAFQRARAAVQGIEFGQPILVGHHSEGRHRAALRRQDMGMRRGVELGKLAERLATAAASVGAAGISSDDPEAPEKLSDKVAELTARRDRMKACNAAFRVKDPAKRAAAIAQLALTPAELREIEDNARFSSGRADCPFPAYALSNLGARIRQASARAEATTVQRARVEAVASGAAAAPEPMQIGAGATAATITQDVEDNRVLLQFADRLPTDAFRVVRSAGFVWSPTRRAFVRKLSAGAVYAAERLAHTLNAPTEATHG